MLDKVREIIADITHNDAPSGWDSIAQINIIVAMEEQFGVTFGAEEMHTLNSVEKIVSALSRFDELNKFDEAGQYTP